MEDRTLSSDLVVCSGFVSLPWHFISTGQVTCSLSGPTHSHVSRHIKEQCLHHPNAGCYFTREQGTTCLLLLSQKVSRNVMCLWSAIDQPHWNQQDAQVTIRHFQVLLCIIHATGGEVGGLAPAWVLGGAVCLPVPILPSALPPSWCKRSANDEGLRRPFNAILGTLALGCYRDEVLVEVSGHCFLGWVTWTQQQAMLTDQEAARVQPICQLHLQWDHRREWWKRTEGKVAPNILSGNDKLIISQLSGSISTN